MNTSNLVSLLRERHKGGIASGWGDDAILDKKAADEIERLRTALERIESRSHTMSDADDEQALFDIGEIANAALQRSAPETTAEVSK